MKKSKLLNIIPTLKKWEIRKLYQFLESPYFNQRKDVIRLLDFLLGEADKKNPNFNQASAFAFVYPDKAFSESKYYLISSYLFKLIEEFLAIRDIKSDETTLSIHLIKAYRKRNMAENFGVTFKKLKISQEKQNLRDSKYLRRSYDFELEYYDFVGSRSRAKENNIETVSNLFDAYYIAEKLKQYCMQWTHQTVFKKEYSLGLKKEILQFLANNNELFEYSAITIYYHCYMAISTGEDIYFEQLLALINKHGKEFSPEEMRAIYFIAINFCIRQLNDGDNHHEQKMFELYKDGIENGYLLINGEISSFTFKNTVSIGINANQFDWVEIFIRESTDKLAKNIRKNTANYSLAYLRYKQKNYKESMKLLASFDASDIFISLDAKLLLLRIYYELEEYDTLTSLLDSMRVYLNRKEVLGYHKDLYKNIITVTFKLLALQDYDKASKETLRKQILEIKTINTREWFLEQLEKR